MDDLDCRLTVRKIPCKTPPHSRKKIQNGPESETSVKERKL